MAISSAYSTRPVPTARASSPWWGTDMRRQTPTPPPIITRVNVTPIIDVALVLVIILLVTAPLISVADLGVHLPQAHTREAEDERNVSITLGTDGRLALDDRTIARDQLRALLAA